MTKNRVTVLEEKIINLNSEIEAITKEKDESIALSNESKTSLEQVIYILNFEAFLKL
jgi:hypothetical protein